MDGIVRGIIIGIDWLVWCIKKNLQGFRGKSIVLMENCEDFAWGKVICFIFFRIG